MPEINENECVMRVDVEQVPKPGPFPIRIGNIKHGDNGIYIGRPFFGRKGSPLRNPFKQAKGEPNGATLDRYRQYLTAEIAAGNPAILEELARIQQARRDGEVMLICWCKPNPCHGDIIKEIVEGMPFQGPME